MTQEQEGVLTPTACSCGCQVEAPAKEYHGDCCSHEHHHDDCCGHEHHHDGCCSHDHEHEEGGCCCCGHDHEHGFEGRNKVALIVCGTAVVLMLIAEFLLQSEPVALALGIAAVAAGLVIVLPETWNSLKAHSIDINVLMVVAVAGATYVGALEEAAMVLLLYIIGEYLEGRATKKSGDAISELAELAPTHAQVVRNGQVVEVSTDEIALGETIRLIPGTASPLDGCISAGSSLFNEAAVTGESIPVRKDVGDRVYAASIIVDGACDIVTTSTVENSTLAKITEMVRAARSEKSATETFVTRFARVYTPIVIVLAALVAFLPPILTATGIAQLGTLNQWMYTACTLLVISCPCAFVISTPATVVSALARAARIGVLVKGGTYFEAAAKVKAVAFDKTGTLTEGEPRVTDVMSMDGFDRDEVVRIAATLESSSSHPLARAVVYYAQMSTPELIDGFKETAGKGVTAELEGTTYYVGSRTFIAESLPEVSLDEFDTWAQQHAASTILVARGGANACVMGALAVADALRPDAAAVIEKLHHSHPAKHVIMLTGDNEQAARAVAAEVGVDEVCAGLLPQDKTERLQKLATDHETVAFVGDGINDAPSIAAANVGIAMGGAGNDAVLNSADVVLMADDLHALPQFFDLSRKTVNVIRQNITFALGVKIFTMVLAIMQLIPMWVAVFADSGLTVLVVANGMRLLRMKLK